MALQPITKNLLGVALARKAAGAEIAAAIDANTLAVAASARLVTTTAASLAITVATHDNKFVVMNSTHTQTFTLPQAVGSGGTFTFLVGTKGTDGSKIIKVANATDIIQGVSLIANTQATLVNGFASTATDDTVTLNNSTSGGFVGDMVEIEDILTGVFAVRVTGNATGTVVTPFSSGV
jgi:hypothetical protein